jgi:transposase
MGKKEPVPNRQYAGEFKIESVRRSGSTGGNAAAKRLGIPRSTITIRVRRGKAMTLGEAQAVPARRPIRSRRPRELGGFTPAEALHEHLRTQRTSAFGTTG